MMKKGSGTPQQAEISAFLGKGTSFKGVLSFTGTIRVDGKVEGEVVSQDTLIVGNDAYLNGEIGVGTLISSGKIEGNVIATQKIHLLAPATVSGNIITPVLILEEGVLFDGNCEMKVDRRQDQKVVSLSDRQP
jgi:cytoskeletal protein CcmA (bactofilin family)